MELNAIAEILPPDESEKAQRDAKGRFAEGHGFAKGRQPGALSWNTRAVRDAMMTALDNVSGGDGGVAYFMVLAASKPELFMPMLAKLVPVKLAGDDEDEQSAILITRVEHVFK